MLLHGYAADYQKFLTQLLTQPMNFYDFGWLHLHIILSNGKRSKTGCNFNEFRLA